MAPKLKKDRNKKTPNPKRVKTKSLVDPNANLQAAEGDEGGPVGGLVAVAAAPVVAEGAVQAQVPPVVKPPVQPGAEEAEVRPPVVKPPVQPGAEEDEEDEVRPPVVEPPVPVQDVEGAPADESEADKRWRAEMAEKADKADKDEKAAKKTRKTPVHLTDDQEIDLAEWIKQQPIIYSRGDKEFLDVQKRKLLWHGKAQELKISRKFTFHSPFSIALLLCGISFRNIVKHVV